LVLRLYIALDALLKFYTPLLLGYIYGRVFRVDEKFTMRLSRLVLYILLPLLLFDSIYSKGRKGDFSELGLITIVAIAGVAISLAVSIAVFRNSFDKVMCTFYPNSGYLPIPIAISMWGKDAVSYVGFFIIGSNVTSNILIPLLSALDLKRGLRRLKYYPPIYAALSALALAVLGVEVPTTILDVLEPIGETAPIIALIVLGIETTYLKEFEYDGLKVYLVRLMLAPVMVTLAVFLNLTELAVKVVELESIMPPAVTNIILSNEYNINPRKVAGIVLTSTLISTFIVIPMAIFGFLAC